MKKFYRFLILLIFFLLLFLAGIINREYEEVEFNANILCLSCIGIE